MRRGTSVPSSYRLIFQVAFEHVFFADDLLRGVRIVPVAACHDMLRRAGVLLRPQENGIAAFGDAEVVQRLHLHIGDAGAPLAMAFQVFFTDPGFFDYTAPQWPVGHILLLTTATGAFDASGRQMLHAAPCVPAAALRARDDADIVRILGARALPPTPAMVLQVEVSRGLLDTPAPAGRHYHVRFDAASDPVSSAGNPAARGQDGNAMARPAQFHQAGQ